MCLLDVLVDDWMGWCLVVVDVLVDDGMRWGLVMVFLLGVDRAVSLPLRVECWRESHGMVVASAPLLLKHLSFLVVLGLVGIMGSQIVFHLGHHMVTVGLRVHVHIDMVDVCVPESMRLLGFVRLISVDWPVWEVLNHRTVCLFQVTVPWNDMRVCNDIVVGRHVGVLLNHVEIIEPSVLVLV